MTQTSNREIWREAEVRDDDRNNYRVQTPTVSWEEAELALQGLKEILAAADRCAELEKERGEALRVLGMAGTPDGPLVTRIRWFVKQPNHLLNLASKRARETESQVYQLRSREKLLEAEVERLRTLVAEHEEVLSVAGAVRIDLEDQHAGFGELLAGHKRVWAAMDARPSADASVIVEVLAQLPDKHEGKDHDQDEP